MLRPVCTTCPNSGVCPLRLTRTQGRQDSPEPELKSFLFRKKDDGDLTALMRDNVMTVRQGSLKVTTQESEVLQIITPGEVFGLEVHLTQSPVPLAAKPLIPEIEVCALPWTAFDRLMQERPDLQRIMLKLMARQALTSRIGYHWARRSLRERAILMLVHLRDRFGVRYGQFKMVDVPLTKIDLASLMCTVQESAVRILSEFREDGLISSNGKRIIIVDNERLDKMAQKVLSTEGNSDTDSKKNLTDKHD